MSLVHPGEQRRQLGALLSDASIEVTAREPKVAEGLREYFPPGIGVHVTFLPDDELSTCEETCIRLRRAGYNPIPHLTARNFTDAAQLEHHLARLSAEAQVERVLLIAGDVDAPRGAFGESLDVMYTGLLAKHGVRTCLLAGHPEGHPKVGDDVLDTALDEKIALAQQQGLQPEIVTQFCFESDAIVSWLEHIRERHVDVPVRIGVAGPASTAALLKFGIRCGIGNSLRALRRNAPGIGKLFGETKPDELLSDVADGLAARELGPLAGIHLYMFGGIRRTATWLSDFRAQAAQSVESIRSLNTASP
jgi:methylenetetrahydrofolate reductase (NADPH)